MISGDGWLKYSIWEHSQTVKDLYARRCRLEVEEMTCAVQAVELLQPYLQAGETLLDVGCGSGYFYHSLRSRQIPVAYYGIDASPSLIEIGQSVLPAYGLPPEQLQTLRIEDLAGTTDHVLCMNVLSNIDNYHRPLERLLQAAKKTILIRESIAEVAHYNYVEDKYLDEGYPLKVYVNTYAKAEIIAFMQSYGFEVSAYMDWRTQGKPEYVIDYPHHWLFLQGVYW